MLYFVLASLTVSLWWSPMTVEAIGCYECDSSNNFTCTEFWDVNLPSVSQYLSYDCSHVYEVRMKILITLLSMGLSREDCIIFLWSFLLWTIWYW
jgi:hypothetical protein